MKLTHLQALLLNTMTAASAVHTPQKTTAGNVKSRKERHDMKWEKRKKSGNKKKTYQEPFLKH